MLSPGFRLFALLGLAAFVSAIVFGVATGNTANDDYLGIVDTEAWKGVLSLGWEGGVGEHLGYVLFVVLGAVAVGLGAMLAIFRDGDAEAAPELAETETVPEAYFTQSRNFWPAVMAFGLIVILVGLVTHAAILVIGLVVGGVAFLEWVIFAWAERLTGDPSTNLKIRSRIMAPVEIPVLGAAGVAVLALGASRIFLSVSEINAIWVGTGIAILIFGAAVFLAARPKIPKAVIAGVLALAAMGIIAAGIAYAVAGSRDFHHEESSQEVETAE